jgi:hypothetical protein
MALTNVTGDRLPPFSFRNRIINGDMKIDQRNGGVQQIVTTAGAYTCDRWIVAPTGNSVAGKQVANSSGWFYTITGNTSVTAVSFKNRTEGNNVIDLIGSSVTLSAKIFSTTLTTLTWNALYPNNALDTWTTGANNINFANGTFTINSTPTIYTSTFTVNTSCSNGLAIEFTTGSFTSGNLSFTDVQLESGSIPTPFERLSVGQQIQNCQRYFNAILPSMPVSAGTTTSVALSLSFPTMRIGPGIVIPYTDGSYTSSGTPGAGQWNLQAVGVAAYSKTGTFTISSAGGDSNHAIIIMYGITLSGIPNFVSCTSMANIVANAEIY